MGKLAKKVQGAIPVVSLVSKLLTPEGGIGVETLSYNEYCRIKLDAAGGTAYGEALSELCDAGKKEPRAAAAPDLDGVRGRRAFAGGPGDERRARLASTGFDYEYEIYKFEQARDEALGRMRRGGRSGPGTRLARQAAAAALEVCLGGVDGLDDAGKERVRVVAEATISPV